MKRLAAALAAATLAGCAAAPQMVTHAINNMNANDMQKLYTSAKTAVTGTREVTAAEEVALGAGIASNLLGAAPLWHDRKAQAYVNTVGHWVARQSERPELNWRFAVLDDNELNAYAAPGGYVFVSRGLLLSLRSEAELAGVLAHEIAHVVARHHLNLMTKQSVWQFGSDLGSMVMEKNGNAVPAVDPRVTEWGLKAAKAGMQVYARGLDKDDEFEADRMAVVLAARAGYDPFGLPAVLQSLQAVNPDNPGLAMLFKTHPPFGARLDKLALAMGSSFDHYDNAATLDKRFKSQVSVPKAMR
jgi:predicted Zn-dependent protease